MVLVFVFWGICTLFPQQLHDFALTKIAQGYQIFHILTTYVVFCYKHTRTHTHTHIHHPILHRHIWFCILLWFWFAFPWWLVILSIFPYTCWSFVYFLSKISTHILCTNCIIIIFYCWVVGFAYIFWILTFYHIYGFQVCSPIMQIASSSCWLFHTLSRSFLFEGVFICSFLFLLYFFLVP